MKPHNNTIYIPVLVLLTLFGLSACSRQDDHAGTEIEKTVNNQINYMKKQEINSSVTAYTLENGREPESLEELVGAGYLGAEDIVDHNGETFSYSPKTSTTTVSKTCGSCGKPVPRSSKAGDQCPHCGVVWGHEKTHHTTQNAP